jgi:hypothetical protein
MQLDHVAVGVAHKDNLRVGTEAHGAAAQLDADVNDGRRAKA